MSLSKRNRPIEVKILVALFVWVAIWNALRFLQAFRYWRSLIDYGTDRNPSYLVVSGGVWASIALILACVLWQGKSWAWGASLGGLTGYGLWVWFDRLFVQEQHANEPFALAGAIAGFAITLSLIFSKHVRDFYHER